MLCWITYLTQAGIRKLKTRQQILQAVCVIDSNQLGVKVTLFFNDNKR